ncbi:MAG: 3-oxoacyl-[acyl-carrier-protein] reductase [Saccharofermentanales bacterium]
MLQGKTALVTGGSRGIGAAIALKLAANHADVAIVYAGNSAAAEKVRDEINAGGGRCLAYQCDVSDFEQTAALVSHVIADLGGIDILVNNAGIVKDGLILSMKEKDFDAVVSTNLKGAFNMIKHTYLHFMKKRSGRIINITSVVGLTGNAGQANYAASKAGLIGLTKSVAKELGGRNVLCNAVAPGYIETDMTGSLSDKVKESFVGAIPLKRPGTPEEVADVVLFLASGLSGYMTGEVLRVDGGLAM